MGVYHDGEFTVGCCRSGSPYPELQAVLRAGTCAVPRERSQIADCGRKSAFTVRLLDTDKRGGTKLYACGRMPREVGGNVLHFAGLCR